ncbi:tonB-system energizer ExbB [Falsirhodobacter xinxiangensis]|uniref:tonB-system energizer ExbB n=1 Tax=Falsirhodobacter xinxiangensis TaxID=2530049 RepID=UPI0010AA77FF|nr:tonB-system energizer ExbB [Rhodobacter xinxiangensis]
MNMTKTLRRIAPIVLALCLTPAFAQETAPTVPTEAPAENTAPAAGPAPIAPAADAPALPTTEVAPTATDPTAAAPTAAAPAPQADAPILPTHDLSPMGMYEQAHWVVKAVMIALLVACFVTWTVLVFKTVEMMVAKSRLRRATRAIREGQTLSSTAGSVQGRRDPASFMVLAALDEMHRSEPALKEAGNAGAKERVRSILDRIEAQAGRRLRKGTGVLASIGSVAPFVGLFGTVWGIMNSFIGIAESGTTNLAVVAPGIAEALLATAIGLVAAIPAVVIYNAFARQITDYRAGLADAAAGVERLVSRDLDFGKSGRLSLAAE